MFIGVKTRRFLQGFCRLMGGHNWEDGPRDWQEHCLYCQFTRRRVEKPPADFWKTGSIN